MYDIIKPNKCTLRFARACVLKSRGALHASTGKSCARFSARIQTRMHAPRGASTRTDWVQATHVASSVRLNNNNQIWWVSPMSTARARTRAMESVLLRTFCVTIVQLCLRSYTHACPARRSAYTVTSRLFPSPSFRVPFVRTFACSLVRSLFRFVSLVQHAEHVFVATPPDGKCRRTPRPGRVRTGP